MKDQEMENDGIELQPQIESGKGVEAEPVLETETLGAASDNAGDENFEGDEDSDADDKVDEAELHLAAEHPSVDGETLQAVALEGSDAETETEVTKTSHLNLKIEDLSADQLDALTASMEAILFMSDSPLSIAKLRAMIDSDISLPVYRQLMTKLRQDYALTHRGIDLVEVSMGFQIRTKPQMAPVLRRIVKTVPLKLTSPMMEVLALVAYKQPVTKDEVDQVRGVDCSYLLRTLMDKKLLRISGRSELPGRPMLYSTTHEFLELFSLKDLTALPPLHEIEAMVAESEVGATGREEEALKQFGTMVDASLNTKLFVEGDLDQELEDIKSVIEGISTSTIFIDEQKAREKLFTKLSNLERKGMTLDAEENEVPLDSVSREEVLPILLSNLHDRLVAKYKEEAEIQAAARAQLETEAEVEAEFDAEEAVESELDADAAPSLAEEEAPYEPVIYPPYSASGDEASAEAETPHTPSDELVEQAQLAQDQRHTEQLTKTLQVSGQESAEDDLAPEDSDETAERSKDPEINV